MIAVVVKESADYGGFLVPPDREADEDGIDFGEVDVYRSDCRAARLVEMLSGAARLIVDPVDILGRIRLFGHKAHHFCTCDGCQVPGRKFGVARVGEVDEGGES